MGGHICVFFLLWYLFKLVNVCILSFSGGEFFVVLVLVFLFSNVLLVKILESDSFCFYPLA